MVITRIPRPQQKFFRTGGFAPEMWLVIEMLKKEFYAAFGDEFRYQFNFIFMERIRQINRNGQMCEENLI